MSADRSTSRRFGDKLIVGQAQQQVQTFFDELKNGTRNYRTITSLSSQITQEYRGRCILEMLQNAHDALTNAEPDDQRRISFVLSTTPDPVLLIGNSGRPFRTEDFDGICQLGQSPKDPNTSVGNKGLGFRSVLEVSACPEVWSTAPAGSDTSFVFRFDPSISDRVAAAAQDIERQGLGARSPFDIERPLVDWSREQLDQYRKKVSDAGLDVVREIKLLSPYLFPLPIKGTLPEVKKLLDAGHTTVVRLRLDGGKAGACENAVQSVRDQLQELDAKSTIFLPHLEALVIDIDGERCILERAVDSDVKLPGCQRTRQQGLLVGSSGPMPDNNTTRQFHVWIRDLGGDDDPEQAKRISAVVEHLPNRWPEVRQATVGIAVEDASAHQQGVFVIFLPTEMTTGTGAHVNAPFYGSLDRRQVKFDEQPYNELLLDSVLDLCLDAVAGLTSEQPEEWRARAVIDILSSTTTVDGWDWRLMDDLQERASKRDSGLDNQALVLCDGGWRIPPRARIIPDFPGDKPISAELWREHAEFAVVSTALDSRRAAVKALLTKLNGSLSPTHCEWRQTIERMATQIQAHNIGVTWNGFLDSLVSVLPANLRSEPRAGDSDPLFDTKFLPTQDARLLSASDAAKLFFPPVRGVDAAAELVGEVPNSIKHLVAFLHPDIRTQEEGQKHRNTPVQKFLDGRFVRGFRREELFRDIVLAALPPLPALHGGSEADRCSELFTWALKILGKGESDTLVPLLKRLPVACHGGWFAMSDAVFGPGWPDRLGDLVWSLADELPEDASERLRKTALLPPDDPRWGAAVEGRDELFDRVGVVDGLRLQNAPEVRFRMTSSSYELPGKPPPGTPQAAWDAWREAVREEAKPYYESLFEYALSGIQLLPESQYLTTLSPSGRNALSRLVLASLGSWPAGWESATIKKLSGNAWSRTVMSPLRYWLSTLAWLDDRIPTEQPLARRWLVPASFLRGQRDRFRHLDPLSVDLARRLEADPKLRAALTGLGLNVYPMEEDRTGPELLDALATAWAAKRVPTGRLDVFLGQIRDAWRHLDPEKGLPETFLVWSGQRRFSTLGQDELANIYLPDNQDRTRSLRAHGKHILEMQPADANRMAETLLAATDIRRASTLEERFFVDGDRWTGVFDGIPPLDGTRYAWLPAPLLTIAAHGGARPAGAATKRWREAADRLRRAHVLECETIAVQLVDDHVVAESKPEAQWLPGDVLAMRRRRSYESLAPAAQVMLDRQDLLKDLRLVLGALDGYEEPTSKQIEVAMERAEIDAQALADVRHRWAGDISLLLDRIRPVLALLGVPDDGLDAAAANIEHLAEWLSSNLQQWAAPEVLSAARQSRDDHAMGVAAWRALGDVAQLSEWNETLGVLGDRYVAVENCRAGEQTAAHLEAATPLLRGFARYAAVDAGNPDLFGKIEAVSQSFKGREDWSTRWWEVPFGTIIDELRSGYAKIPVTGHHLEVLEGANTVDDLRAVFQRRKIATDRDPYDTASLNKKELDEVLRHVHDLRRAWMDLRASEPIVPGSPEPSAEFDAAAYLSLWSDDELLARALCVIDDAEFVSACNGCKSLNEIRERLGLDPEVIDARRQERLRGEREAERQRRTFNVADASFEVGTTSYRELFERLNSLAGPEGPRASKDAFTPLTIVRPSSGGSGGGNKGGKTSHLRHSAELRDLVGVVGEMHAYRFLRAEFGNDVVTRDAWVSEIRLKVLTPVVGQPNTTSDGLGFDFRFRYCGKRWHVEVKATRGDDPQFDLGISEIEAASRLAQVQGELWRILRVRNALSAKPEFDWLPNPFKEDARRYFRLHKGGMIVSYTRKKT